MTGRELEERIAEIEELAVVIECLKLRGAILSWEISQEVTADERVRDQ